MQNAVRNARLRYGHAPGHVRETFANAVEEFLIWKPGEAEPPRIDHIQGKDANEITTKALSP